MSGAVGREPTAYLAVDGFIEGYVESLALERALHLGIIDQIADEGIDQTSLSPRLRYFLGLLGSSGVLDVTGPRAHLTEQFRAALGFRDLLEAKLAFGRLIAQDLAGDATRLLGLRRSEEGYEPRYAKYFAYAIPDDGDPDRMQATAEWVSLMTVLTKYESAVAFDRYDFSRHRVMLDVGGNSGEFALQACEDTPGLEATVFDLPDVVRVAGELQAGRPALDSVRFVAGDAFADQLPTGCDLVTFKGVLHDWPDEEAAHLLDSAWHALEPGGTLLVFERSAVPVELEYPKRFSSLTMLMWGYIFSGPQRYVDQLRGMGATEVTVQELELDLPWLLLTAVKPTSSTDARP